jgi:DNA-directed RNA polymerase subunit RPC12/RpoP
MEWFDKFRERAYKLHKKGKISMVSTGPNHSAYKEKEDVKIHVRYICPHCGHKDELYEDLGFPYKVKCSQCRKIVWKTKIQKKRGRKKKKK